MTNRYFRNTTIIHTNYIPAFLSLLATAVLC